MSSARLRSLRLPLALCATGAVLSSAVALQGTDPLGQDAPARIDREQLLKDLSVLAHDSMEGRRAGTPGAVRARTYIEQRMDAMALDRVGGARTQEFALDDRDAGAEVGANVLAVVPGTSNPGSYFVVSAHYDHLGVDGSDIYNGADDNASGTAALLALADYFTANPTGHSLLFVALDAEEGGLRGARHFVADPPVSLDSVALNVNLDMVSRSEAGELYAAGTYHYPALIPLVEEAAARSRIQLLIGHDSPEWGASDDWTQMSDHAAFHERDIPFVYFGVEDHAGYHRPSDTFENITPDFYVDAVETIADFIRIADTGEELIP